MLLTLLSSIFLILSFPKFSLWPCAWFAFVPILCRLESLKRKRKIFLYSYLLGVFFLFASWEWLRHVTYFGLALVPIYALYFGIFGMIAYWFLSRRHFFLSLFALPSAWTVLEWVRTEIPDWGFGWNLLAFSQSSVLPVAGMAAFIGAYGVSWLIMFANVTVFLAVYFFRFRCKVNLLEFVFGAVFLAMIFGYHSNYQASRKEPSASASIRAAVVQGNIPQEEKWDPQYKLGILETHEKLSRLVSFEEQPDLIVWPEAAYPGFLNLDRLKQRLMDFQKELQIPILLGAPFLAEDRETAHNSAYLIDHRRSDIDRYDKMRLVAFGEYMPPHYFFEMLGLKRFAYSLGVSDFSPGKDVKVFSLPSGPTARRGGGDENRKFSVLICFEDTFPFLARRFVDQGAQVLIVITNDAWFGKSAAPYQHLQASVFRAIENGVPIIRSANTGVSGFISKDGEVLDRVKDKQGYDTFIMGGLIRSVVLSSRGVLQYAPTFYRKHGYLFPIYCLIFLVLSFIVTLIWKKQ